MCLNALLPLHISSYQWPHWGRSQGLANPKSCSWGCRPLWVLQGCVLAGCWHSTEVHWQAAPPQELFVSQAPGLALEGNGGVLSLLWCSLLCFGGNTHLGTGRAAPAVVAECKNSSEDVGGISRSPGALQELTHLQI